MRWEEEDVVMLQPGGGKLAVRGFTHREVAVAVVEGEWLVLHRRSGLELGRFPREGLAHDLGARLTRQVSQSLKRPPETWAEGLWGRLEEIRAEHARENGLPSPPSLRSVPPTVK